MKEISLKVTKKALDYLLKQKKWKQAQIAIVSPKFEATSTDRCEISIGGVINLTVGDTHAIWHSHNTTSEHQKKNFERLFALLANNPDQIVKFLYNENS